MIRTRRAAAALSFVAVLVVAAATFVLGQAFGADGESALATDEDAVEASGGGTLSAKAESTPAAVVIVTLEQYNAAVQATAACAEAAGVAVAVEPGKGLQPARLTFTAPTHGDAEAAKAALDACEAEHLNDVETAWALQQANQPDDAVHQAFSLLTECMVAKGAHGPQFDDGFFSRDELNELTPRIHEHRPGDMELFEHYLSCRGQVTAETGFYLP